jgi:2-polyprenyl-3-methyl-5-hydroxy-6-metoxy-1,4-benzoquinol methylase
MRTNTSDRSANCVVVGDLLACPTTGAALSFVGDAYVSPTDPRVRFPIEEGIIRAFLPHDGFDADVTQAIQAFYEQTPFPDYDEMETVGSLIEKSLSRGFPEMLNRSIPPHARVLEVGCGTGQLGNFLGIAQRDVLSVDICLNSLRLAQRFKEAHALSGVTFAQMNLFRLVAQPAAFDTVICSGVLHHTSDPKRGFKQLTPLVKRGGHIVLGLYNRYGRLKTRARRALRSVFGDRLARIDPFLSGHDVSGSKKQAWLMDQYRNPHESLHTIDEILAWFDDAGLRFVRAIPSTVLGSDFELEYRTSLFDPEPRGSRADRLFSQLHQMLTDVEGGLFIMIGRRD